MEELETKKYAGIDLGRTRGTGRDDRRKFSTV